MNGTNITINVFNNILKMIGLAVIFADLRLFLPQAL